MASLIFPYYYCHNSEIVCHKTPCRSLISCLMQAVYLFLPPTLKKLMGHIAFGAFVRACMGACVTLFVPTVTFKPLKLES